MNAVSAPVMDYREIYARHAARYHELVSAEDHRGELAKSLGTLAALADKDVLDVGAGTGRVSRILLDAGARVTALEAAAAMLEVARGNLASYGERVRLVQGDARELPFTESSFDVAVAGWVFGHFRYWNEPGWREDVGRAIGELRRVVRPGGALLVIETLGTGASEPGAPNPRLAEYYAWLEGEQGFRRTAIATDYQFPDAETAAELVEFFFGGELAERVKSDRSRVVPEWTGIWSCSTARGRV